MLRQRAAYHREAAEVPLHDHVQAPAFQHILSLYMQRQQPIRLITWVREQMTTSKPYRSD